MTETFTEQVFIDGSGDETQLRVQGHSTQNESLQTWENSAGAILAQLTGDGRLQIGDDLATPDSLFEAHRAETSTSKPKRGFHSLGRISDALGNAAQWIVQELEVRGTSALSALQTALRVRAVNMNTGTPVSGAEIRAADIEVINDSTAGSNALPKAVGLQIGVTNAAGKTIAEATGLRVKMNNAGSISTPYAIYTEGLGVIHLDDYVEIKRPTSVPGTPTTDYVRIYPKSDGKLYAKNWSGTEFDLTGGGGGGSVALPGISNGRLTLTSATPVTISDVTAATTLYFTPLQGNLVSLYNGSSWAVYSFTQRSLSLSGLVANRNHDIFLYDNSGTLTLEAVAWTNDTTRATAIVLQDGVYVKSGATSRRYLGTIRTTATTGQTEDSAKKRFVYNEYNQAPRKLLVKESASSWSYSTSAWRSANNNSANRVEVVVGNIRPLVDLNLLVRLTGSGAGGIHGIGYDSTTSSVIDIYPNISNDGHISAHLRHNPAVGYHYYQWVENGRGQATTVYGYTATAYESGMVGEVTL